jgi:hypothetical protein
LSCEESEDFLETDFAAQLGAFTSLTREVLVWRRFWKVRIDDTRFLDVTEQDCYINHFGELGVFAIHISSHRFNMRIGNGIELVIEQECFLRRYCTRIHQSSLQEPLWHLRTPNSQRLVSSRAPTDRRIFVHQVAVGIVLDHVAGSIPPCESPSQHNSPATRANIDDKEMQKTYNNQTAATPKYASRSPKRSYNLFQLAIDARGAACRSHGPQNYNDAHAPWRSSS